MQAFKSEKLGWKTDHNTSNWHVKVKSGMMFKCFAYLNVNNVSHLVTGQVGGQMLDSLALVGPREHVPSATPVTLGISHLAVCCWCGLSEELEKQEIVVTAVT